MPEACGVRTSPRAAEARDLGRLPYEEALRIQNALAARRRQGEGVDTLLLVEHPHVITIGRNGREENLLASLETLNRAGVAVFESDRGGDVTYHGPGQIVGYPVMDLRNWKRDVGAFVRALEQVLIDTLEEFGITASRIPKLTGVWVDDAKVAAIGVHLSRWVSTHGWALNVATDLRYFQYIVPCGLTRPVTSMERLGVRASMDEVKGALTRHFSKIFDYEMGELAA